MEPHQNIIDLITQLENDHQHGAHHFAERALDIMCAAAKEHTGENSKEMLRAMWRVGKCLVEIRPSMSAGIIHAVTGLWELVLNEFLVNPAICPLKSWVRDKKGQLLKQLDRAIEAASNNAAYAIPDGSTLFLFSHSSSVIRTIEKTTSKGIKVIVAESRPLYEGVKTAEECSELGVDTTLITDSQAGIIMKNCSLVLIGADAVLPSGDVVNKAGTSLIAAVAADHGVPLYIVAHTWKIHPGETVVLEEKDPSEVLKGIHPFRIRNVYFDITPASRIKAVITEEGQMTTAQVSLAAESIRQSFEAFMSNPISA